MKEKIPFHQSKIFFHSLIAVAFALALSIIIFHFSEVEPDFKGAVLEKLGLKMENSAIHAHWKWKAEEKPERIMLLHYNARGREIDRRPVTMFHNGWPRVEPGSKGCQKLWRMLVSEPMLIDGFKIYGDYYTGETVNGETPNARCRFRMSSGRFFDYAVNRGEVTLDTDYD